MDKKQTDPHAIQSAFLNLKHLGFVLEGYSLWNSATEQANLNLSSSPVPEGQSFEPLQRHRQSAGQMSSKHGHAQRLHSDATSEASSG